MHKFLGPVLEKVHFDPQVRQLRDGFNVMCEIAFQRVDVRINASALLDRA